MLGGYKNSSDPFVIQIKKIKQSFIKRRFQEWVAPVNFSGDSTENYLDLEKRTEFLGKIVNNQKRLQIFFFFIIFSIFVLAAKSFYLQILKGKYYLNAAEGNRIITKSIKAQRGIIFDRNKKLLVQNIPSFLITINYNDLPTDVSKREKIFKEISQVIDIPYEEIKKKIEKSKDLLSPITILEENVDYEKAIKLKIENEKWPYINIESTSIRKYLNEDGKILSLSHILGYEGIINEEEFSQLMDRGYSITDYIGKAGLELSYEDILRGRNGSEQIEVDALGKQIQKLSYKEPIPGQDIVLSIDIELQKYAEKILKKHLEENKKTKGVIIVLNPKNGEILALVSLPSYDNNLFARKIKPEEYQYLLNNREKPFFNRAISGEYPPGSTIKPIVGVGALEEGIINENTTIYSSGGIYINKWFFPDWKAGGHGRTNIIKAIAQSVNTFFYYVGGGYKDFKGLGVEKIVHYAQLFGLGHRTGIDIFGEKDGFLPSKDWKENTKKEQWYIGDTYHLAIGQGDILVTPLQSSVVTMAFANGGILYKPHVVKEIIDLRNDTTKTIESTILNTDFVNPYNLDIIRRGLREAVLSGSARGLLGLNIQAAGKTGTAQWNSKKKPHAWFTSFAPYDNPELVVTVLVEEGGEGSSVALPIARDIYKWWFKKDVKTDSE